MRLKEDLLQYIWSLIRAYQDTLKTTIGEDLVIQKQGFKNLHEGPDFKEAVLTIGEQSWAGNVEIHVLASDWLQHGHQQDANYENVILHVVYEADIAIKRMDGTTIPTVELKNYISEKQLTVYRSLMYNELQIPCQKLLYSVEPIKLGLMLQKAALERLEEKSKMLLAQISNHQQDWNLLFYLLLAENFGFKTNSKPFRALAESIPLQLLAKHKESPLEVHALLYGQAAMLNGKPKDDYQKELVNTYQFMKNKYGLEISENIAWKNMKTRPANFPSLRISQFAHLVSQSSHLFSKILTVQNTLELIALFRCEASDYWKYHSSFGSKRKNEISVKIGASSLHLILINTVATVLYAYGTANDLEHFKDRAINLLQALPAENNKYIKRFSNLGFSFNSALDSQGGLGLHKNFCLPRKCLECIIGKSLLA